MEILKQCQFYSYKICYNVLKNQHDAEDATQDVLIKIIKNIHTFDKNSKLTAWISRVSLNQAIDYHRKNIKNKSSNMIEHTSSEISSSDTFDQNIIYEHINQLKDNEKDLILNRYINKMSLKEISALTLTPTSTIHEHIQKALDLLKASLKKSGFASLALSFIPLLENVSAADLTKDLTQDLHFESLTTNIQSDTTITNVLSKSPLLQKCLLPSLLLIPIGLLTLAFIYFIDPFTENPIENSPQQPKESLSDNTIPIKSEIANITEPIATKQDEIKNYAPDKKDLPKEEIKTNAIQQLKSEKINKKYFGIITDEKTNLPIEGVAVEVYDLITYEKMMLTTNKEGKYFSKELADKPFLYYVKFTKDRYAMKFIFQDFNKKSITKVTLTEGENISYSIIDEDGHLYQNGELVAYQPHELYRPVGATYGNAKLTKIQYSNMQDIYLMLPSYLKVQKVGNIVEGRVNFNHISTKNSSFGFRFVFNGYSSDWVSKYAFPNDPMNTISFSKPIDIKLTIKDLYSGKNIEQGFINIRYKNSRKNEIKPFNSLGQINTYIFNSILVKMSDVGSFNTSFPFVLVNSKYQSSFFGGQFRNSKPVYYFKEKAKISGRLIDSNGNTYSNCHLTTDNYNAIIRSDKFGYIEDTYIKSDFSKFKIWNANFSKLLFTSHVTVHPGGNYNISDLLMQDNRHQFKIQILLKDKPIKGMKVQVKSASGSIYKRQKKTITPSTKGYYKFEGFKSAKYQLKFSFKGEDNVRQDNTYIISYRDLIQNKLVLNFNQKLIIKPTNKNKSKLETMGGISLKKENISLRKYPKNLKLLKNHFFYLFEPGKYLYEYAANSISSPILQLDEIKKIHTFEVDINNMKSHKTCLVVFKAPDGTKRLKDINFSLNYQVTIQYEKELSIEYNLGQHNLLNSKKVNQGSIIKVRLNHPEYITFNDFIFIPKVEEFTCQLNLKKSNCVIFIAGNHEHSKIIKKLKSNDIILTYNHKPILNKGQFKLLHNEVIGNEVDIKIIRDGEQLNLKIPAFKIFGLSNHLISKK